MTTHVIVGGSCADPALSGNQLPALMKATKAQGHIWVLGTAAVTHHVIAVTTSFKKQNVYTEVDISVQSVIEGNLTGSRVSTFVPGGTVNNVEEETNSTTVFWGLRGQLLGELIPSVVVPDGYELASIPVVDNSIVFDGGCFGETSAKVLGVPVERRDYRRYGLVSGKVVVSDRHDAATISLESLRSLLSA